MVRTEANTTAYANEERPRKPLPSGLRFRVALRFAQRIAAAPDAVLLPSVAVFHTLYADRRWKTLRTG